MVSTNYLCKHMHSSLHGEWKERIYMTWWPFRRRSHDASPMAQETHEGDPTRRSLMGRLFLRGVPYVLPKDMGEVNRLDFQHYMMRAALHGNYALPSLLLRAFSMWAVAPVAGPSRWPSSSPLPGWSASMWWLRR
jgi:hypothetical protein